MCSVKAANEAQSHMGFISELRKAKNPRRQFGGLAAVASVDGWAHPSAAFGAAVLSLLGAAPLATTCALRRPLCTWAGISEAAMEDSKALALLLAVLLPLCLTLNAAIPYCRYLLQRRRLVGPALWSRMDKAFERVWPQDRLTNRSMQQRLDWGLWDFHEAPAAGFLLPADVSLHRAPPEVCEWESRVLEELHDRSQNGWALLDVIPEHELLL